MGALIEKTGRGLGYASILVMIATLLALPWLLGGVIPLARFLLLAGSLAAAGLSLLSVLLDRSRKSHVPLLLLPLLGIASLGLWQLQPAPTPLVTQMESALTPIPQSLDAVQEMGGSLSADGTRSTTAIYLSLCLIALCSTHQLVTRSLLTLAGAALLLNAVAVSSLGFVLIIDQDGLSWNHQWLVSDNVTAHAFSTFINPNNAAGWLCLAYSCAIGWATYLMKRTAAQGRQKYGRLNVSRLEQFWQRSVYFLADLTPWQILASILVVFLAAAVLATQSRGGALALVFGTLLVVGLRSSMRALPGVLVAFVVCGAGIFGLLRWMDVDDQVVGEIESLTTIQVSTDTRILLWLDSLNIVRDFPLLGTGLGSYKFAVLPYQSQESRLWFQNADNQFVEMLVEGGLVGFVLMLLVGLVGILTSVAATRQRHQKTTGAAVSGVRVSRRLLSAVGMVAGVATLTQAFSGLFDFGIALPAASSVFILILGSCCGFLCQSDSTGKILQRVALPCPRLLLVVVYGVPGWFGYGLLEDQWHAAQIDETIVAGRRLLRQPVSPDQLQQVPEAIKRLTEQVVLRPDDWTAHQTLMWLHIARFRYDAMRANDAGVDNNDKFHALWTRTSLFEIAGRLSVLRTEDPYLRYDWLKELAVIGGRLRLPDRLRELHERFPLIPHLAEERARLDCIFDLGDLPALSDDAVFVRPADSTLRYELGLLAAWNRKYDDARQQWEASLALSNRHRGDVLDAVAGFSSPTKAMEQFAPETYVHAVEAALTVHDEQLITALWQLAEQLWKRESLPLDENACLLRATHLQQRSSVQAAIEWLRSCLDNPGTNVEISVRLATLLEQEERYKDAFDQWSRVRLFDPENIKAAEAIARLLNRDQ